MSEIVTTDKKLFCRDRELLKEAMRSEGFIFKNSDRRVEEYLTDIDSYMTQEKYNFVLTRKNNKEMKLNYPVGIRDNKVFEQLTLDLLEHKKALDLLSSLGYYKYITADILRETYIKKDKEYIYHIIIETVDGVGNFVEIEVITDSEDGKEKLEELKQLLIKLSLEEILESECEIIAKEIYEKNFKRIKLTKILIEVEKIVEEMDKLEIDKAVLTPKTFIHLELIKKLETAGIEVVIVSSSKSKEDIDTIREKINQLGYEIQLIDIHDIKEISVKETLIIEKQKKYDFTEVALTVLNHLNR